MTDLTSLEWVSLRILTGPLIKHDVRHWEKGSASIKGPSCSKHNTSHDPRFVLARKKVVTTKRKHPNETWDDLLKSHFPRFHTGYLYESNLVFNMYDNDCT